MNSAKLALFAFMMIGCAAESVPDVTDQSSSERVSALGHSAGPNRDLLRTALQDGLDKLRADGVVGTIGRVVDGRDAIDARSGVSRLGTKLPVAFESEFRMGSNTKTFVAVVILQLVD